MPRDAITTPLALVGLAALIGLMWICVSSGAAESKRIAKVNQENVHVTRR